MRRQLVPLALLSLAAACGDGGPTGPAGPVPGVLKIALTTPNAAAAGYQIYTAQPDTLTTRILVTGDIGAGEVVRIHVPDTRSAAAYHATIAQAASRATFAQRVLAGYALAVAP
jgi:hypothetical protein